MKRGLFHIIRRSLIYYKRGVLNQIVIIAILAAVITGSLLTGYSVRNSLRTTAFTRLGNTSILVSSGLRYFDPSLSQRFAVKSGEKSVSILEIDGFCQNFSQGVLSKKVRIFGIGNDFFMFHGNASAQLNVGEVAINKRLAQQININKGDEVIIRFRSISDIPADAPFSTSTPGGGSLVMKVGMILEENEGGDFSLGINQIVPSNVYINLSDLNSSSSNEIKVNRLLVQNTNKRKLSSFKAILRSTIILSDIGLTLRKIEMTGGSEIISDRIFIDKVIIDDIKKAIPSATPVITYLANSISSGKYETPYSFVAAIPSELYPQIVSGKGIILNTWLARDINVTLGDSIRVSWYAPDSINQLKEKSDNFIVKRIVQLDSIWADRTLMPDFPGISGSETCSEWDAGVPVMMNKIREKDEEYWKNFKGTPKAFISYDSGKELWGNNFGPATAIRFPTQIAQDDIARKLTGIFEPERSGFVIADLREDALKAVRESVDFGTLFLSLGFFIILSSILLLSLATSAYFALKKNHIFTLFAIGFTNKMILKLLFSETLIIASLGAFIGALSGFLVNNLIISALNSVWRGAVQTDTLSASAGIAPMLSGFIITLVIIVLFFWFKARHFLKSLSVKKEGVIKIPSIKNNLYFLVSIAAITIVSLSLSVFLKEISTQLYFIAGSALFLSMVLLMRQYYLGGFKLQNPGKNRFSDFSRLYYRHNPSHAVAPIIFIAAGIFALFITSLNRMESDSGISDLSGGTGGYLLWCETGVPVDEDLTTNKGKLEFGLDDDIFKEADIVQFARKEGDDASCLNLNHIVTPAIIGFDPSVFIKRKAFSFASVISDFTGENPWELLDMTPGRNTIYGIADQTVLDWGLKIKCGDTLIIRAETGEPLNIILAAGLKSSVFQGNVIISSGSLRKYFPSVSGSSLLLIDGKSEFSEKYRQVLGERFANYGISVIPSKERLESFYEVTNTYLSVFTVLGALGMIMGIFGLGFILLRNYNQRNKEFAIISATGFSINKIRRSLLSDLIIILSAGIITGVISAMVATLPSIQGNSNISWSILIIMVTSVFITGVVTLLISIRAIKNETLIINLRRE
jgi:ABC-type antimicrobial peptide transport system permease subunit